MIDALGSVGSLLLVGGTSDIAVATARRYLQERPLRVTLAARDTPRRAKVADDLRAAGATVAVVDFDAEDPASPARMLAEAAAGGDIDVALLAFGQLGDQARLATDADAVAALGQVNYVAPTVVGTLLADHLRMQGHGVIVALSSVAGERPGRRTSSTARPRREWMPSSPGWPTPWSVPVCRCWSSGPGSCARS